MLLQAIFAVSLVCELFHLSTPPNDYSRAHAIRPGYPTLFSSSHNNHRPVSYPMINSMAQSLTRHQVHEASSEPIVPSGVNGASNALQGYQIQLMLLENMNERTLLMAQQKQVNSINNDTLIVDPSSAFEAPLPPYVDVAGHTLQDYQMQQMLLEQRNRKIFLMARQEKDNPAWDGMSNAGLPSAFAASGVPSCARASSVLSEPYWTTASPSSFSPMYTTRLYSSTHTTPLYSRRSPYKKLVGTKSGMSQVSGHPDGEGSGKPALLPLPGISDLI